MWGNNIGLQQPLLERCMYLGELIGPQADVGKGRPDDTDDACHEPLQEDTEERIRIHTLHDEIQCDISGGAA